MAAAAVLAVAATGVGVWLASGGSPAPVGPRWGYVDATGELVVPAHFEAARAFVGDRAAVREGGLWGFVDRTGHWTLAPRFAELCDPAPGPSCARDAESGKWGFVSYDGAWVVPPIWDAARPMSDGVGPVGRVVGRTPGPIGQGEVPVVHWGLVDAAGGGRPPAPLGDADAWTDVGAFGEGLLPVESGGRWGYVDATGAWALPPRYLGAKPFRGSFAGVSGGRWAVIDRAGGLVVPAKDGLSDGASEGRITGADGYYDLGGNPVGPRWEWVRPLRGGLGAAMRGGKWGLVGPDGEARVEPRFDRLTDVDGGVALAAVLADGAFTWGIVDAQGAWVAEPRWVAVDEAGFREGVAAVALPEPEAAGL